MFQLNNNHKFTLKNDKISSAICNNPTYGPIFGGPVKGERDLVIHNDANLNRNSYANIGQSYINNDYTLNDTHSQIKFSGERNFTLA